MTGFVTLAVGDDRYYKLAANLLQSYRLNGNCDAPFAIFADRENEYTDLFDEVIIMEHPHLSYMDKLEMLRMPPFEHNIFIDADCLIYNDVELLVCNAGLSGVRCFGKALELTATNGWFLIGDIGEYKERVQFIPSMHGGIIYFSDDFLTKKIYDDAIKIALNYSKYRFKYFENPADEPILALSMAINNTEPIELRENTDIQPFCFLPTVKSIEMNIKKRYLTYIMHDGSERGETVVLHWQNCMTKTPIYYREIDRMTKGCVEITCLFILRQIWYHVTSMCLRVASWGKRRFSSNSLKKGC